MKTITYRRRFDLDEQAIYKDSYRSQMILWWLLTSLLSIKNKLSSHVAPIFHLLDVVVFVDVLVVVIVVLVDVVVLLVVLLDVLVVLVDVLVVLVDVPVVLVDVLVLLVVLELVDVVAVLVVLVDVVILFDTIPDVPEMVISNRSFNMNECR